MAEKIINKYAEDGICYPNMTLNIRSMPCATTGEVLDQYYEGESVIYDYVVITDQYVWISWLSSGGNRRVYMAVKDQATGERFGLCTDIPIGSGGNQGAEVISNEYAEDGICYPNRTINIRSIPCATTGIILDQYYEGESVVYDYVVITDQHVWISWTSAGSGRRVYMAVKDQATGERFGFCTDIPGSGGSSGGGAPMPGVKKVFIDPGHGGSDPGASGHGLKEDEIVLNIAKKLGNLLTSKGIAVKYSRTSDVYVDLAERSRLANEWGADLFVSVHTNAFNGSSYGTECYTHPGDSLEAKQLSANVASTISSKLGLYNRGHKEADFAVLRLSKMPAILIETAFIDNANEAIILRDKADEFANAIYKAITGLDANSTPSLDYSQLFKGDYLQRIIDSSYLLNQMAFEFTSDDLSAKSYPIKVSDDPIVMVHGEIAASAKIGAGEAVTFEFDGSSTIQSHIMGNLLGADLETNFEEGDLDKLLEVAGLVIPFGESLQAATKITGANSMEITVEHEVDTSSLPEQFKKYKLYSRIIINIFFTKRFNILHTPIYAYEKKYELNEEAKVDWGRAIKNDGLVIGGIAVGAVLLGLFIIMGGGLPAIGSTIATIANIGIRILEGMFIRS